jgi:hypothetical protein
MSPCENINLPAGGTAIVCSRGGKTECAPGAEAVTDPNGWRCPNCGRRAEVYEAADGRMLVRKHGSRYG